MKIDRHARQTAKKYFRACLRPDGSLNETGIREIIQLLVQEKPRNYIAVLSRMQRLIELAVEERTVRVESASPLADQGTGIFAELERRFGPPARTSYEFNPSLLGGVRIRRGSNIWDGSIRGRLNRLERVFA
ncbi:MAG TPA: F0F1 ATP synthase subunit delta [Candidatus Methylacidiphilales bacterium]|nr:F0F1 ATP synthase subunit delta [Candidatus Methylacidiphilales bacterium]